ncbi:helix-turn-helix domain-containing protein [Chitinophaga lutea]
MDHGSNIQSQFPEFYLYQRLVQAKRLIDENYAAQIDLARMGEAAFFSKFHFIRLFKRIYFQTPHQYLTTIRLEKARQLLEQGASVSDACAGVGFDSLSSFSGKFKTRFGESPSAYARRCLRRKAAIADNPLQFVPGCFASQSGWLENSNFEETRPAGIR